MEEEQLKYPIGKPQPKQGYTLEDRAEGISVIRGFPSEMRKVLEGLTEDQLHWRYRPYGWSIMQVVHHCADSHMNCFTRFKLALTEENPTVRPYFEGLWALLPDTLESELEPSLRMLEGIHQRWSLLMDRMDDDDWEKTFVHPEYQKDISLKEALAIYDWHARHHLEHVRRAIAHKGVFEG